MKQYLGSFSSIRVDTDEPGYFSCLVEARSAREAEKKFLRLLEKQRGSIEKNMGSIRIFLDQITEIQEIPKDGLLTGYSWIKHTHGVWGAIRWSGFLPENAKADVFGHGDESGEVEAFIEIGKSAEKGIEVQESQPAASEHLLQQGGASKNEPAPIIVLEQTRAAEVQAECDGCGAEFADECVCLTPRTDDEIGREVEILVNKVWYNRCYMRPRESWEGPVPPDIQRGADAAAKRIVERYGTQNLGPWTDFEWGMINGKLSALRWACGNEWDFLDT